MENAISGLTIRRLVEELEKEIKEKYLDKVQQVGKNTFKFKITPGPIDLLIEPGKRINITRYRIKAPSKPSQAAMIMRKQLSNQKIEEIEQLNFDRVVKITFTTGKKLLIELFGRGNIVITDEEDKITYVYNPQEMKEREVKKDKKYQPPTLKTINPLQLTPEKFKKEIKKSKNPFLMLTKRMGLGKTLTEEVYEKARLNENKEFTDKDIEKLYKSLKEVINREKEPVKQEGEIRPFPIKGKVEEKYKSINEAIDENYEFTGKKKEDKKTKKELEKLKNRLRNQKKAIKKFKDKVDENKKKGDLIYNNYGKISKAIKLYKKGKEEELEDIGATKERRKILLDLE